MSQVESLANTFTRLLVRNPEAVKVRVDELASTFDIAVEVADADVSRMIGRGGATFHALRWLLAGAARKQKKTIYLHRIKEPRVRSEQREEFTPRAEWPEQSIMEAFTDAAKAIFFHREAISVEIENRESADFDGVKQVSYITLNISSEEQLNIKASMIDPLKTLMHAVCRANGREAVIDVREVEAV